MKKIKLFPAPHVELRIHVSEEMEKDMKRCKGIACSDIDDEDRCDNCSWREVDFLDTCMCELDEVIRQVLGGAE